jgi:hypothetical protein
MMMRKKPSNVGKTVFKVVVGVFATIGAIIAVGATRQLIKDDI